MPVSCGPLVAEIRDTGFPFGTPVMKPLVPSLPLGQGSRPFPFPHHPALLLNPIPRRFLSRGSKLHSALTCSATDVPPLKRTLGHSGNIRRLSLPEQTLKEDSSSFNKLEILLPKCFLEISQVKQISRVKAATSWISA